MPNWSDIHRLSELASTTDAHLLRVRDALLAQTYRRVGATYHPDWAFHQLARGWNLGAPLSDSYRITAGGGDYAIQVYATDILYNVVPNWSDVRRLSALVLPRAATLSADIESESSHPALLSADAQFEPAPAPFQIIHYSGDGMAVATAYGTRSGSKIVLLVLHGDNGPNRRTLNQMTTPGARTATHFYLTSDGTIYQLVAERLAAWHAGEAIWQDRQRNINRISLGMMLERGPSGYSAAQLDALVWLVDTLRGRYGLTSDAIVRWGDIAPAHPADPADFPLQLLIDRLVPGVPARPQA